MSTRRVQTSQRKDEPTPPNIFRDFEWIGNHRNELLEAYGEGVILVYEKQVIGKGNSMREAEADAERRLPPDSGIVTPVTYFLSQDSLFMRINPKSRNEAKLRDSD